MKSLVIFISLTVISIAIFLTVMKIQGITFQNVIGTEIKDEISAEHAEETAGEIVVETGAFAFPAETETLTGGIVGTETGNLSAVSGAVAIMAAETETGRTASGKSIEQIKLEIASAWQNQDYAKAAIGYEELWQAGDTDPAEYSRAVWAYTAKLDRRAAALDLAQKILAANPESGGAYNLVGWAQLALKNYEQAEENLKKALALEPNNAAIYLNFGDLRLEQMQHAKARVNYQRAIQLDGAAGAIGAVAKKQLELIVK